jgi:microsomal dipeptidase-like Zn-dependent dipeptidase
MNIDAIERWTGNLGDVSLKQVDLNHPKRVFDLAEDWTRRKYGDSDIELIHGGNFKRVLKAIWTV